MLERLRNKEHANKIEAIVREVEKQECKYKGGSGRWLEEGKSIHFRSVLEEV